MRRILASAIAAGTALALAGCYGGAGNKFDPYEQIDPLPTDEEYYEPVEIDPGQYDIPPPIPRPEAGAWECYYDETFNYDWHDDVICSNGYESHRPYLLDWLDYVTYDDIMAAAAEYEASLNADG